MKCVIFLFVFFTIKCGFSKEPKEGFPAYPWSEQSPTVRISKELLYKLPISAVTVTNWVTYELALSDNFASTFKLTKTELDQMSDAVAQAQYEYRIAESRHFEPFGAAATNSLNAEITETNRVFRFQFRRFPEESAAIRNKLSAAVLAAIGPQRADFFWRSATELEASLPAFSNQFSTSEPALCSFVLPAHFSGEVEQLCEDSFVRIYVEEMDRYAPQSLQPILAKWRADARKSRERQERRLNRALGVIKLSEFACNPFKIAYEKSNRGESAIQPTGVESTETAPASANDLLNGPGWNDSVAYVDISKAQLKKLKLPGLIREVEFAPETIALFGLSEQDQKDVRDLYLEMERKFEKEELVHFERLERFKNDFVLRAFPEEASTIKSEWNGRLKKMLGPTRGELLDRAIRRSMSLLVRTDAFARSRARLGLSPSIDPGSVWLERGTVEMRITARVDGDASVKIYYSSQNGSGTYEGGQIPERWRHLLTTMQ
jgi:hypothetical protein